MMNNIASLESLIRYEFKNKHLLYQALTHPSANKKGREIDYERLEFVGDSVLSLVISESIYYLYPQEKEGSLAKRRSAIVCKDSLAQIAKDIGLGEYLILGTGEHQSGGRQNLANLENSLEALIAAVYFDGGLRAAKEFINNFFAKYINQMKKPPKDAKSTLQEWAQGKGLGLPKYEMISITGPSHEPLIEIKLEIDNHTKISKASSRKEAERLAAVEVLKEMGLFNEDE
ncbi:MAG TPA: ribonuclease III [Alphaproteobacteria bacterium]|nr:ribonuclease III [Alphaproteobacteria bacterium]